MEYWVIAGVVFLMYMRVIPYEYLIDDQLVPKGKGRNFIHTFWLQMNAQKYCNRYVEHFQRILVHIAVCILIYICFGKNEVAFAAALLFAVNPVNNNAVAWLNGIGYAVSAALVLLMCMYPAASAVPYAYSLWWHVTAFPAPLLFLMTTNWPFAMLIIFYIAILYLVKGKVPFGKVQDNATLAYRLKNKSTYFRKIFLKKMGFVFKTYAYYYILTLVPVRVGLYHTFGYAYGLTKKETDYWNDTTPFFWFACGLIAANIWTIVTWWGTPLAYGLLWYNLFIAQFCNVILLNQTITERYCYLPAVGMMYALAFAIYHFFDLQTARMIVVGIGAAYATKLFYYLPAYKNMEEYVRYNLYEFPDQHAAWNYAGVLHREKGRIFSAMYHWALGLRHDPVSFRLNFNMGMAMRDLGYLANAEEYLDRAEQGLPPEIIAEHKEVLDRERANIRRMKSGFKTPPRMPIPKTWQGEGNEKLNPEAGTDGTPA